MVKYICVRLLIFISGHYYHTNFYDIIGIDNYSKFYQLLIPRPIWVELRAHQDNRGLRVEAVWPAPNRLLPLACFWVSTYCTIQVILSSRSLDVRRLMITFSTKCNTSNIQGRPCWTGWSSFWTKTLRLYSVLKPKQIWRQKHKVRAYFWDNKWDF